MRQSDLIDAIKSFDERHPEGDAFLVTLFLKNGMHLTGGIFYPNASSVKLEVHRRNGTQLDELMPAIIDIESIAAVMLDD